MPSSSVDPVLFPFCGRGLHHGQGVAGFSLSPLQLQVQVRIVIRSWLGLDVILISDPAMIMTSFDPTWEMPVKEWHRDLIRKSGSKTNRIFKGETTILKNGYGASEHDHNALKQPSFASVVNGAPHTFAHPIKSQNAPIRKGKFISVWVNTDAYQEWAKDFCTSCHNVGYLVVKYESIIGKAYPKVGYHGNKNENKASDLGAAPSRTDSNIEAGESVQIPSYNSTVSHQITSWSDTFGDSDDKYDDYVDDRVEDD
ncbi:hypothetical protein FNV43_RR13043 [Rhamnella rubrinervis]|uniref:Uncharacterized protein n=1 Tax=Rhamnella rubrinervis TaxID=2594499 RepID=A0A8K0MEM5_9ROSA|nr:hypothetical protein FNV43_RR13043 [Rhamnella rubrinervis]